MPPTTAKALPPPRVAARAGRAGRAGRAMVVSALVMDIISPCLVDFSARIGHNDNAREIGSPRLPAAGSIPVRRSTEAGGGRPSGRGTIDRPAVPRMTDPNRR
ncbi:hypothetical protein GCM10022236_14320 [Microlunatus ginsengisoli]|uniref:Uncharacterized protein n=1 Tax=Microlunatus ginsengisoli TaxID=363863 RepID=A0ABP6ZME2_9ACTN